MSEKVWKPHKKQAEFLSLPDKIKEAFYGGGAGSAKTETLLYYPIVKGWYNNSRFKQVFMRRTFPELRKEVLPRSRLIYRPFGATFNLQTMAWTFPSGAMVFLAHCENEEDVHKYDSMEINLFTPDELTSFTEYIYTYVGFERTRSPLGSGLPAIIRAAGMPGNIGHTWVKKRFVDAYPGGGKIIIGKGNNLRIYIHATLADNPYIDPAYAQSLDGLPEAERQAKKFGSWDAYLGQVFDEFRDKKYADEPDNALHVIEPFAVPDYWPKIIALDWGYRAMTWVGFGAIGPDKRIYIYRELTWRQTDIEIWAPIVRDFIEKEHPRMIKVCKSAGQDRGQEHTIQEQIESAFGRSVDLTTNTPGSRVAGKILLHEYLRWKPAPKITKDQKEYDDELARWMLRNKGMESYKNYLAQFDNSEVDEPNLPKLQIFNSCPVLVNAIKSCNYAKPKEGKVVEDVAEFDGDDAYDGLRYLIDAADRYFKEAVTEFEKVQETERWTKEFEQTGDYNRIFQRARALNFGRSTNGVKKISGIRRY